MIFGSAYNARIASPEFFMAHHIVAPVMTFVFLAAAGLNGFILVAANRMMRLRGHTAAVCAAVLVIVLSLGGCLTLILIPGGLLGLAFGAWALVVLNRREVKDAFDERATNPPENLSRASEPRFSRTAIAAAIWGLLSLAGLILIFAL
jgi:hypothetical protein